VANSESLGNETVTVEILGRNYTLRAQKNIDYVQSLAKIVNDKMVAVEKSTNTIDSVRVAVLAALNLADEYFTSRETYERRIQSLESERDRLRDLIQGALTEGQIKTLPDA